MGKKFFVTELAVIKGKANLDTLPVHSQTHMQWLLINFPDYHRTGLTKFLKGKDSRENLEAKKKDARRKKWEGRGFFWDPKGNDGKGDRFIICSNENCENRVYPRVVGKLKTCGVCRVNSNIEKLTP